MLCDIDKLDSDEDDNVGCSYSISGIVLLMLVMMMTVTDTQDSLGKPSPEWLNQFGF